MRQTCSACQKTHLIVMKNSIEDVTYSKQRLLEVKIKVTEYSEGSFCFMIKLPWPVNFH